MTADTVQSDPIGLPSPSVSDPDSKPVPVVVKALGNAVPCRRSVRQRRRTAKAAGEDGCTSVEEAVSPRRHRAGSRPAYVCQLCDKEFTKHSSLVRHTYQHSGETFPPCLSCTFASLSICLCHYFQFPLYVSRTQPAGLVFGRLCLFIYLFITRLQCFLKFVFRGSHILADLRLRKEPLHHCIITGKQFGYGCPYETFIVANYISTLCH